MLSPEVRNQIVREDKVVLKDVKLQSFTATPDSLQPFETALLAWEVTGPEDAFQVTLNGHVVPASSSRSMSPVETTIYKLAARAQLSSKTLGSQTVAVLNEACTEGFLTDSLLQIHLYPELEQMFASGSDIDLRRPLSDDDLQINDFGMTLAIPLEMHVPNWFNADVDIELRIEVTSFDGQVKTKLTRLDVDVSWSFLEHLASAFCTTAVQAAVQEVIKGFIRNFVGDSVTRQLERDIQRELEETCSNLPAPSDLKLQKVWTTEGAIYVRCCPLPGRPERRPRARRAPSRPG